MKRLKYLFLDLVFPQYCNGCNIEGMILCNICRQKLGSADTWLAPVCMVCGRMASNTSHACREHHKPSPVIALYAPFRFDGVVRTMLHNLKFHHYRDISPILASLMSEYVRFHRLVIAPDTVIIPMPLHPRRRRMRGFNQSELIAFPLARELGTAYEPHILARIRHSAPQVGLTRDARIKNINNAFIIKNPGIIFKKDIVLFDDIKTTGATLEEAARILKKHGARSIVAITVAR